MTSATDKATVAYIKIPNSEDGSLPEIDISAQGQDVKNVKEGSPCQEVASHIAFDASAKASPQEGAGFGSGKAEIELEPPSGRLCKESIVIHPSDRMAGSMHELDIDQCPITRVIMLAIDSSKHADHALEWAASNFISPASDLVVLVHVRDIPPAPTYGSTIAIDYGFLISGLDEQYRTASHALLKQAAAKLRHANKKLAIKAISIRGEPREELIRKANEIQADVIIVASQGKGFVKRTILGSTTDFLVHHSKCTVLVVKMPGEV